MSYSERHQPQRCPRCNGYAPPAIIRNFCKRWGNEIYENKIQCWNCGRYFEVDGIEPVLWPFQTEWDSGEHKKEFVRYKHKRYRTSRKRRSLLAKLSLESFKVEKYEFRKTNIEKLGIK
jgi:hypothetical protein